MRNLFHESRNRTDDVCEVSPAMCGPNLGTGGFQKMRKSSWIAALLFAATGAANSYAGTITINNNSFENPALTQGNATNTASTTPVPSWTPAVTGSGTLAEYGVYFPTTASYASGAPDGTNIAYISTQGYDISLSQVLGIGLLANDTYTLSLYEGLRGDTIPGLGTAGCGSYSVDLETSAGVITPTTGSAACASAGSFVPLTFTFTTGSSPAGLGDPLSIVLTGIGNGSFNEYDFDNLSLSDAAAATTTPEPGTGVLLAGGLLGMALAVKRRSAAMLALSRGSSAGRNHASAPALGTRRAGCTGDAGASHLRPASGNS